MVHIPNIGFVAVTLWPVCQSLTLDKIKDKIVFSATSKTGFTMSGNDPRSTMFHVGIINASGKLQ